MRIFRGQESLRQARDIPRRVREIVRRELEANAQAYGSEEAAAHHGHIVLIEADDTGATIEAEFGQPWEELVWEGVWREEAECLCGLVLANNEYGRTVVLPPTAPAPWRRVLLAELPKGNAGRRHP